MEIEINWLTPNLAEMSIKDSGTILGLGTMDKEEREELAKKLIAAAGELLS